MNPPQTVKQAINAIWICIGLSAAAALLDRVTGRMTVGDFSVNLIFYGLFVIIPYKLARRSNATRYVYAVLIGMTLLMWVGGAIPPLTLFSKISAIVQMPIEAMVIYWLFAADGAKNWFEGLPEQEAIQPVNDRVEPRI